MPINKKQQIKRAKFTSFFCTLFESVGYQFAMKTKKPDYIDYIENQKYGDSDRSVMDFLVPKNTDGAPLFIYIHGGGFISGKMKNRTAYCMTFAKEGYVSANIEYDLSPEHRFPHQIHQLVKALDYIYAQKDRFNFDPSKTVIAGESAGAYFAIYLSLITHGGYLNDRLDLQFGAVNKFNIKSTILISGAMDIFDMCDSKFVNMKLYIECFTGKTIAELKSCVDMDYIYTLSPIRLIDSSFPPCVVIKSKGDLLKIESDSLVKRLKDNGVDHVMILADGVLSPHAFAICTKIPKGKKLLGKTLEFVRKYVK